MLDDLLRLLLPFTLAQSLLQFFIVKNKAEIADPAKKWTYHLWTSAPFLLLIPVFPLLYHSEGREAWPTVMSLIALTFALNAVAERKYAPAKRQHFASAILSVLYIGTSAVLYINS